MTPAMERAPVTFDIPQPCPSQKIAFATRADAAAEVHKMNRRGGRLAGKKPYKCRQCPWWHVWSPHPKHDRRLS